MPLTDGSSLTSASTAATSGPVVEHRHGHHLDAVRREHREVPVVAGHRADEGDLLLVLPRPGRVDAAVEQVLHEHVVHHRQARAAAGHQLVGVDPEQLGEQLAQLAQAGQPAVVAHVDPVGVLDAVRQRQQPVGQVELRDARLAPGEVELQPALLQPRHRPRAAPRGRPPAPRGSARRGGCGRRWRGSGCSRPYRGRGDGGRVGRVRARAGASRMLAVRCDHPSFGVPGG